MEVKDHKLTGEGMQGFVQTPNVSSGTMHPDTIVIHYTAGPSAEGAVRVLTSPKRKASAHLVVGRDGKVWQLSDFNTITWHAGKATYNAAAKLARPDQNPYFNRFSIGIEIDNAGYLSKIDGKYYAWWQKSSKTSSIPEDQVFEGKHRNAVTRSIFWHKYTEEQIKKVFEICEAICKAYDIQYIVGHEEIIPGGKTDPGPAFPLDELREKLIDKGQVFPPKTVGEVTAEALNIRSHPNAGAEKMSEPLEKGHKLELIKEINSWYKVTTNITGWVAKDYIDLDNSDDEVGGHVSASSLNIRSGPGGANHKIAKPLVKGTPVKILEQNDGWYQVEVAITGWVAKDYVLVQAAT